MTSLCCEVSLIDVLNLYFLCCRQYCTTMDYILSTLKCIVKILKHSTIQREQCIYFSVILVFFPVVRNEKGNKHQNITVTSALTHFHDSTHITLFLHYSDVIMSMMASQITGVSIVYSTVLSGADQRKHQSSTSLAVVRGMQHWFKYWLGAEQAASHYLNQWWKVYWTTRQIWGIW